MLFLRVGRKDDDRQERMPASFRIADHACELDPIEDGHRNVGDEDIR